MSGRHEGESKLQRKFVDFDTVQFMCRACSHLVKNQVGQSENLLTWAGPTITGHIVTEVVIPFGDLRPHVRYVRLCEQLRLKRGKHMVQP